jgi:hypothetical protein
MIERRALRVLTCCEVEQTLVALTVVRVVGVVEAGARDGANLVE